ncbi:MAG: hypothetical protein KDE56_12290 [Anaerolineales bacterium]|nr:hypothetical protein [Anaerolineales bacterium]
MSTTEKVTLTLPHELMQMVRTMAPRRGQSQFVAEALEYFIETKRRQLLREELAAGYQATAQESLALVAEWEAVDDEAWEKHLPVYEAGEPDNGTPDSSR